MSKRALLDTHTFVWPFASAEELPLAVIDFIAEPDTELLLSSVSCAEMAVKSSIGKLRLARPVREFVKVHVVANALTHLPLSWAHAARLESLPLHHHHWVGQRECLLAHGGRFTAQIGR